MQSPAFPADEVERLHALYALRLLDTPPDERFERIVRLAQTIFDVPIASVTLVDSDRQWFKSCVGLDVPETSRDISFCGHAILSKDLFYIPNALEDQRFADNPLVVNAPHIRFYAGAPLTINGRYRVGSFCIIDTKPRVLSEEQQHVLRALADIVEQQLELQTLYEVEKTLIVEKARHQILFESVIDGIIIVDQQGIINDVNPAAQRLFGYSAMEMISNSINMLMTDASYVLHSDFLLKNQQNQHVQHATIELQGKRSNSSTFPIELVISPMQLGQRLMFTAIVRDLSERKEMERVKNEFISTVSHELRTPLTSIRGALGLVLGKASDTLPNKIKMLLETANRNCERLSLLINDILDLEKIESGKLDFEFRLLDLTKVAAQALEANEGYAANHQVSLRLVTTPDNALVFGDDHRLLQVFANLISNAVKYSVAGGTVEIHIDKQSGFWRVGIRDFGRGIPEAFKDRMFQRFSQADSSDTREKGGTGLGLSISKAIVECHHGMIDCHSEVGQGSEFFFTLPVYEQQPAVIIDEVPRLLICEDNPDVALILADLLAREGLHSDIAYSAAEAMTKLAENNYRVMLLDLTLPDMDGMELLYVLRKQPQFSHLPIIIVGSSLPSSGSENWTGEALAIVDWLQKPIDRRKLTDALHRSLRHGVNEASILHVEDELDVIQITQMLVENIASYSYATTLAHARQLLTHQHFDLLLLDMTLPDGNGLELLPYVGADCQVLVFSGQETSHAVSKQVAAALTKSKTSNERLLATIKKLISH